MSCSISCNCPKCEKFVDLDISGQGQISCPECKKNFNQINLSSPAYNPCPICECKQFYVQKDFNQFLGCLVMLVGIVLVPWTYGLSLPVFALIDWLIYKRIPSVVVCYRCGADFREFTISDKLKPFMHHIGMKYDKYRKKS